MACWLVVLGVFALLQPIALDLQPGDAKVKSAGSFSWQSASSVFVLPGEHRLRASREGYVPAEVTVKVGGPAQAHALIHLVKLPGKLAGGHRRRRRGDFRRRRARSGAVPGTVDVPAGERTLTFKAPRYLDHVERLTIEGGGEKQQLKVALKPNLRASSASVSVPAGAQIEVDGKAGGRHAREGRNGFGHPPRAGFVAGTAPLDLERRGERGHAAKHRPHRARRRRRARHRALGAVRRAGDHRRQFPRHHAR